MNSFAPEELLACAIARLVADAAHVAVGAASPIPATGVFLCKFLYKKTLRISLLHQRSGNPFTEGSRELFDLAGQGRIDVFFLGGAQIDGAANLNLLRAEGRRFPGSFGSAFMYFAARRTILFREEHSRRVLVPKVEFISAPGSSPPEVWRRGGPQALLTGKALFAWQPAQRRFRLQSVHPACTAAEIREHTGFEYDEDPAPPHTPVPSGSELALLRGAVRDAVTENYPEFGQRVWPAGAAR
jgi:glutaconate CoA-transferase subunit B